MRGAKSLSLKRLLVSAAVLSAAAISGAAHAGPATAATKQGTARAEVLTPLSFIKIDDLNFGKIIPKAVAGTVTVSPANVRTSTNGIILVGNTQTPALFAGDGSSGQLVDISLGANTINVTGPGAPMQVNTFVIGSTPTAILSPTPLRFRIGSATGIFAFPVGATLNVGANQATGTYTGTWSITLQYQ